MQYNWKDEIKELLERLCAAVDNQDEMIEEIIKTIDDLLEQEYRVGRLHESYKQTKFTTTYSGRSKE